MDYIEIKAPAKINLGLYVTSKREDGYHNIETVFYPLKDLYDTLHFRMGDHFTFRSNIPELENQHNLIIKAKEILELHSQKKITAEVELNKVIPVGAGLGGGSSDAAAALLSFNEMFNLGYNIETLQKFALILGSDVPFFIRSKPAFAESRGEILNIIDLDIPYPILIVNPGIHISTKEAYGNIVPRQASFNLKELTQEIIGSKTDLSFIKNDFEDYVFKAYSEIKSIKEQLYEYGARFALMSGSGSTVYGIFNSIEEADKAKWSFPKEYFTFINTPSE